MWYLFGSSTELGVIAEVYGDQYNVNEAAPNGSNIDVQLSNVTLGPVLKQRISGAFYARVETGFTLNRRFEFEGDTFDGTFDLDRVAYVRTGVALRPSVGQ